MFRVPDAELSRSVTPSPPQASAHADLHVDARALKKRGRPADDDSEENDNDGDEIMGEDKIVGGDEEEAVAPATDAPATGDPVTDAHAKACGGRGGSGSRSGHPSKKARAT